MKENVRLTVRIKAREGKRMNEREFDRLQKRENE
jgi:hypothetical protein